MLAPSWLGGPIVYIYTVNNIIKIYSKGVSFDFLDSLNCFKTNNSAYFNLSSALAKGICYFFYHWAENSPRPADSPKNVNKCPTSAKKTSKYVSF